MNVRKDLKVSYARRVSKPFPSHKGLQANAFEHCLGCFQEVLTYEVHFNLFLSKHLDVNCESCRLQRNCEAERHSTTVSHVLRIPTTCARVRVGPSFWTNVIGQNFDIVDTSPRYWVHLQPTKRRRRKRMTKKKPCDDIKLQR